VCYEGMDGGFIVDNGQTFEVAKVGGCCVGKFAEGNAHRFSTCAAHFFLERGVLLCTFVWCGVG